MLRSTGISGHCPNRTFFFPERSACKLLFSRFHFSRNISAATLTLILPVQSYILNGCGQGRLPAITPPEPAKAKLDRDRRNHSLLHNSSSPQEPPLMLVIMESNRHPSLRCCGRGVNPRFQKVGQTTNSSSEARHGTLSQLVSLKFLLSLLFSSSPPHWAQNTYTL